MPSYFKRHYLDDVKLAQRALLEFDRSLRSGRMIAFTGAMTTESCGYGTWDELIEFYAHLGTGVVKWLEGKGEGPLPKLDEIVEGKEKLNETIQAALDYRKASGRLDPRVVLGIIEEVVLARTAELPDQLDMPAIERIDGEFDTVRAPIDILSTMTAQYFRAPMRKNGFDESKVELDKVQPGSTPESIDVVRALIQSLGIRRFATLNYDFELEARLMLHGPDNPEPFKRMRKLRGRTDGLTWDAESGRVRRILSGGLAVESDILNRERIDRMLEFAIGADDVDRHVLHIHGRACRSNSMILSYRDYDRLYRNNDLAKLPFEFAQRIMIGGNPILFVGLGMSENEVNEALQDFVSASPYQRMAPTFLLWNQNLPRSKAKGGDPGSWREIEMRRLDWFHRLGILTIFDTDLIGLPSDVDAEPLIEIGKDATASLKKSSEGSGPTAYRAATVRNLAWLIRNVADGARKVSIRENRVDAARWRQMSGKVGDKARRSRQNHPIVLWDVQKLHAPSGRDEDIALVRLIADFADKIEANRGSKLIGVIGFPGNGHGAQTRELAKQAQKHGITASQILLVNVCFSFDTDSILDGVARFLHAHTGVSYVDEAGRPLFSRGEFFSRLAIRPVDRRRKPLLIVFNGLERLYSLSGELLSAEFDELLYYARMGMPGINWILFGTQRVRKDWEARKLETFEIASRNLEEGRAKSPGENIPVRRYETIRSAVAKLFEKEAEPAPADPAGARALDQAIANFLANSPSKIPSDGLDLRRAFYDLYLGPLFREAVKLSVKRNDRDGSLPSEVVVRASAVARELLRALAFIGVPTEIPVLLQVPRVRARLTALAPPGTAGVDHAAIVAAVIGSLIELGYVIQIRGFPDPGNDKTLDNRFALPRTLLTELRYRFSVPLSEAKLSTAFNMSLYVAQPVDGYIPEPEIHDELGETIDRLLGAYRDPPVSATADLSDENARVLTDWFARMEGEIVPHERLAAGARRRGFGRENQLHDELAAVCTSGHAQCLRAALALVRGYYTTTDLLTLDVGDRLIREDRDGILLEHAERLDCLIDAFGKTSMMRDAVRAAIVNREIVRPVWFAELDPFYPDEIVWLHNERGVVRLAMGDLIEAAQSFERALEINRRHVERLDRSHNWRRIELNLLVVQVEQGNLSLALRKAEEIIAVSAKSQKRANLQKKSEEPTEMREDRLATAIATGFKGRVCFLQGDRASARELYGAAIAELSKLNEFRAQAIFLRMRSELEDASAAEDLAGAVDLANATRQMDIVYRLRVIQALAALDDPKCLDRAREQKILDAAMRYALQTDVHHIRVEAGAAQARVRLASGDYEGALRHVADAMMVATRFGMELRKIWLRSLMARIMAARGHPVTAQKLALSAIRIASRRRYERAIEHAEETLTSLPYVSAINEVIDAAMRRRL